MATVYVTEFARQGRDAAGYVAPAAAEPAVANQKVTIGASSAQSSAFNALTAMVRICTDAACSIEFGTDPTATADIRRMPADAIEYFVVPVGKSYKVAVITNT